MKPEIGAYIFFLAALFLFHGGWVHASNSYESTAATDFQSFPSYMLASETNHDDDCDEAWEWYYEGLLLSDNSVQEAYYYQQAIELCPELVDAQNRLGEVYKNRKQFVLSLNAFEKAKLDALSSNSFATRSGTKDLYLESIINKGEVYRILGMHKRAAEEFNKALLMDPDSLAAQNQLQYIYKRMHLYDSVLSPHNRMLSPLPFSGVSPMTLPQQSFIFYLKYHYWQQTMTLTADMFDQDTLHILTPISESAESFLRNIRVANAPETSETDIHEIILAIEYGLTNDLTIGLIPKYFSRKLQVQLTGFENQSLPQAEGLGDTQLLLKYQVWGRANRRLAKHLSIYTMFNLPTGGEMEVVSDRPLISLSRENPTQPGVIVTRVLPFKRYVPLGSESYDITPGLAFALDYDPVTFFSNLQYMFTNGELIGDELKLNCGLVYRTNPSVNATIELNYRWRGDARRRQHLILNSFQPLFVGPRGSVEAAGPVEAEAYFTAAGGHTLFLSPGVQFTVAEHVTIELGLQLPVIKQAEGWAEDIVFHLAVRLTSF